jgi:hypothetical protein
MIDEARTFWSFAVIGAFVELMRSGQETNRLNGGGSNEARNDWTSTFEG